VTERLFVCVQIEGVSVLGGVDGRYVLRDSPGGDPRHVLVIATEPATGDDQPRRVITVIDPASLPSTSEAQRWLAELDPDTATADAAAVIDGAAKAHRIATSDPQAGAFHPAEARSIRAGWGTGEQVADGHLEQWRDLAAAPVGEQRGAAGRLLHRALPLKRPKRGAIDSSQRFVGLLGGRVALLLCEELALRARRDLDRGDRRLAAVELERAYAAALVELAVDPAPAMTERLQELRSLTAAVSAASEAAVHESDDSAGALVAPNDGPPVEDPVTHALKRLEAALRARAAAAAYGAK
jgi:hypothetical protein